MNLEILVTGLMIMFILSTITEKISNFIKLNDFINKKDIFKDIKIRTDSEEDEKNREKKIQIISIIIGVMVAVICKANIFDILTDENFQLFWKDEKDWEIFTAVIGSIICGIFLSFGSKFFHDLLDLVFQIKELKNKLNTKELSEIKNMKEFDEYFNADEYSNAESAVSEKKLMNVAGVVGISVHKENGDFYCDLYCTKDNVKVDESIPFYSYGNKIKFIKVRQFKTEEIIAHSEIKPSYEIANSNPYYNGLRGTLGCIVRFKNSDDPLLLTCYHAVFGTDHNWDYFNFKSKSVVSSGQIIGEIIDAKRNFRYDFALIKPEISVNVSNQIPRIGIPLYNEDIAKAYTKKGTKVKKRGKITLDTNGIIESTNFAGTIFYPDGEYHELVKLIKINSTGSGRFSDNGDSGSLLISEDKYAIGIVVAGTSSYSLAYPITQLFKDYNLTTFI